MNKSSFMIDDIVLAHRFNSQPGWLSTEYAATRPRHGLVYVLEGCASYEMAGGRSFIARKNDILYIPEGVPYLTRCGAEAFLHMTINFKIHGAIDLPELRRCDENERTRHDMATLVAEWTHRRPNYREKSIGLLYLLICSQMEYAHRDAEGSMERLKPALNILDKGYSQDISVSALAASCGISEVYFRKMFEKAIGMSPTAYITHTRMSYACELLQNTNLNVESICYESGYRDPTYFCRAFKQYTGQTPTVYRCKNRL